MVKFMMHILDMDIKSVLVWLGSGTRGASFRHVMRGSPNILLSPHLQVWGAKARMAPTPIRLGQDKPAFGWELEPFWPGLPITEVIRR
jgi:hypothetical protein